LFSFVRQGCEFGALVRAVAKWLIVTFAARTPEVFGTFFHIHWERRFLRHSWFCHESIPLFIIKTVLR